jgi:hypothetical protein
MRRIIFRKVSRAALFTMHERKCIDQPPTEVGGEAPDHEGGRGLVGFAD